MPSRITETHRKVQETLSNPAVSFGYTFTGGMAFFVYVGIKIDQHAASSPWGILGGVAMGLFFGFYELWKLVRFFNRQAEKEQDKT